MASYCKKCSMEVLRSLYETDKTQIDAKVIQCTDIPHIYVCKVICPKAGLFLDIHYQGSAYLSLLDKRKEWGSMSSPFLTEPVALWEYLSLHTQTQIQLLSIPYLK